MTVAGPVWQSPPAKTPSKPGTCWSELSADGRLLMIHVLDLHDEQWWVDTIKTRYEKPLMAIFE